MKNVSNSAKSCRPAIALYSLCIGFQDTAILFCSLIQISALHTGCKKEGIDKAYDEEQSTSLLTFKAAGNVVTQYDGLSRQTLWELQQARAATARYRDIKNAIKDGYADINVVVQNMGCHYMKADLVDGTFNSREPEILVYNKDEQGNFQLVAVEYAVPLNLPEPEGFTGSDDVWDGNAGFNLWLLHAWVWSYNSDGVFSPTNPLVHLH